MVWQGFGNRKFPRVDLGIDIQIKHDDSAAQNAKLKNIGIGGVGLMSAERFGLFEEIALEFDLPGSESPINCQGTVMWTVKTQDKSGKKTFYDMGVEFVGLQKTDKTRIEEFIVNLLDKKNKE